MENIPNPDMKWTFLRQVRISEITHSCKCRIPRTFELLKWYVFSYLVMEERMKMDHCIHRVKNTPYLRNRERRKLIINQSVHQFYQKNNSLKIRNVQRIKIKNENINSRKNTVLCFSITNFSPTSKQQNQKSIDEKRAKQEVIWKWWIV